jgi:hypothetical protein
MSKYLMFNDDQLAKFRVFSRSLKNPHAGAHDAKPKLRHRAHDEEMPAHVAREMEREGQGPDRHSTRRLSRVVRELFGELAHNRFEEVVGQRWPESLKNHDELMNDLHEQRLDEDTDEDAEDETEQSSVAEEPLGEDDEDETDVSRLRDDQFRKQQNRKSDQKSRIGEDLPPAFPGRPTPGGRMLPNSPNGTGPRKNSIAGDAARYAQRWPSAAVISSDPPRRPRIVAKDRKERKTAFLALDSKSKNSYAERFPSTKRIKVI